MDTNMKNVTLLRAIPALALVLAFALSGCSKSPDEQLADARSQLAAKEHTTAIITLKNLLQDSPDNLEARLLLAEASLAMGDPLSAEKEITRAGELGAESGRLLNLHYRTQLTLGQHANVLELLASGDGTDGVSDKDANQYRGEALLGLGSLIEAQAAFEDILTQEPGDPMASWGLATATASQGNSDIAAGIAEGLVGSHPDFARGWLIKGQLALRTGELENAAKDLQVAADKAAAEPDKFIEVVALASLGDAQLGLRDVEAAEPTIRRLASLTGPTPLTGMLIARLGMAQQDYTLAAAELERVLNVDPVNLQATLLLAAVNVSQKHYVLAEVLLRRVLSTNPDNLTARRMLAAAQVEMDDPSAAAETLLPLLDTAGDDPELSIFASQALLQSGDSQRAIALLEQSLDADPSNVEVRTRLAATYLSAGRSADAERMIEQIPEGGSFQRGIILAFAYAAQDRFDQADDEITKLVDSYADDSSALILAADFYIRRNDVQRASELLILAISADENDVLAKYALASLERRQGKLDEASQLYEAALLIEPGHLRSLTALADMSARDGEIEQSIELLNTAVEAHPNAANPRLMLAQALFRDGDILAAVQSANEAIKLAPENAAILAAASGVLLDAGKAREALGYLRLAVELRPDFAAYHFGLARAHSSLSQSVEARKALKEAVRLAPDSLRATSALALLEVREGYPERAFELVEQLKRQQLDSLAPFALEASVLARLGRHAEAAEIYSHIYAEQPSGISALNAYRAGRRAGLDNPQQLLAEWVSEHPDDIPATVNLAGWHEQSGDINEAVRLYEHVLNFDENNALVSNNLAWIYNERGDKRAEPLARRAYEQRSDSPSIMDTLGWILIGKGKLDEGLSLLEQASAAAPDSRDTLYHLSVAAQKSGDNERSKQILNQILADNEPFAERSAAEELLMEIGN